MLALVLIMRMVDPMTICVKTLMQFSESSLEKVFI